MGGYTDVPNAEEEELIEGISQLQFEDGTLITLVDKEMDVWEDTDGNRYNSEGVPLEV